MMGGEEFFSCWLEGPPAAGRLRAVCAELVRATITQVGEQAAADAERAGRPTAEAAFGLGLSLLNAQHGGHADLGRAWLWVAAAVGHSRAASELAREITQEARQPTPRRDLADLMDLIAEWLRRASTPNFGGFSDGAKAALQTPPRPPVMAVPYPAPPYEEELAEELPDPDEGVVGVVALPRVGDPTSRDGQDIAKRYGGAIGRRLPFRGRLPDPGEVACEFLTRFPWATTLGRYLEGQFSLLRASGNEHPRLPPLLLVGPSGCGKTTMLEWLAAYCELPSQTVPVGGSNDSAGITAVARGWVTSHVAAPVQLMADNFCCNPVMILDELDKGVDMGGQNGSVMGALLAILQAPAEGYWDSCLMANTVLRYVTFLASANSLAPISDPLRKRFQVIRVPSPGPEHFEAILPGIRESEGKRLGVSVEMLPWLSPTDVEWLRTVYLRARGDLRAVNQAYQILSGERAADEAQAMMRPN